MPTLADEQHNSVEKSVLKRARDDESRTSFSQKVPRYQQQTSVAKLVVRELQNSEGSSSFRQNVPRNEHHDSVAKSVVRNLRDNDVSKSYEQQEEIPIPPWRKNTTKQSSAQVVRRMFDNYNEFLQAALQQCQYIWSNDGNSYTHQRKSWRSTWGSIQSRLKGCFHSIVDCKAPRLSEKQVNDLTNEALLLRSKLANSGDAPNLEFLLEQLSRNVADTVCWSKVLEQVDDEQTQEYLQITQKKLDTCWHQLRRLAKDAAAYNNRNTEAF